jgi:hypothetical protein
MSKKIKIIMTAVAVVSILGGGFAVHTAAQNALLEEDRLQTISEQQPATAGENVLEPTVPATSPAQTAPEGEVTGQSIQGSFIDPIRSALGENLIGTTTATTTFWQTGEFAGIPALSASEPTPRPKILEVRDDGSVLMRGFVLANNGVDTIAISGWGGIWTIRSMETTEIAPSEPGTFGNISNIPVGDFIGIIGEVSETQAFTVNATFIRNWTATGGFNLQTPGTPDTGIAEQTGDWVDPMTLPRQSFFMGSISDVQDGSFNLRDLGGINYNVLVDTQGAIIWDTDRMAIDYSEFQEGDVVRINGSLEGNTITPMIIRNTSR